ncbi:MAG: carboxylesterase family protein, partial [Bacteroidota bacterium]
MKYQYLILGLLVVFAVACKPEKIEKDQEQQKTYSCSDTDRFSETDFFTEGEIDTEFDVRYGSAIDWQGADTELLFDVFYPRMELDSLSLRPAIMTIHGGGFQGGSKESWRDECLEFAKKGFVAFTIQYRLG